MALCSEEGWCEGLTLIIKKAGRGSARTFKVEEMALVDGTLKGILVYWFERDRNIIIKSCPACGADPQARFGKIRK